MFECCVLYVLRFCENILTYFCTIYVFNVWVLYWCTGSTFLLVSAVVFFSKFLNKTSLLMQINC